MSAVFFGMRWMDSLMSVSARRRMDAMPRTIPGASTSTCSTAAHRTHSQVRVGGGDCVRVLPRSGRMRPEVRRLSLPQQADRLPSSLRPLPRSASGTPRRKQRIGPSCGEAESERRQTMRCALWLAVMPNAWVL